MATTEIKASIKAYSTRVWPFLFRFWLNLFLGFTRSSYLFPNECLLGDG